MKRGSILRQKSTTRSYLVHAMGATERTNEQAGAATELAATSANDDETPTIACYSPLDGNPKELKLRGS